MNSTDFQTFANDLAHYSGYPLIIIGVLGNILCIFVLFRPKMKESNIRTYLIGLSFNDIGVFVILMIDKWLRHSYRIQLRLTSQFACKLLPFLDKYVLETSSLIVLLISIERMVAIVFPIRYYNLKSKHQRFVLCIMFFILVAFNSPALYFYTLNHSKCYDSAPKYFIKIKYIIFYIFYWILPVIGLLITNGIILYCLKKRSDSVNIKAKQQTFLKLKQKVKEGLYLLFMISALFLLCTSPFAICGIVITTYKGNKNTTFAKNVFAVYVLAHFFSYFNNALNFAVYMLASSSFRQELKGFLRIKSK
ncbi:melatonin receptor type 1A [Octopus bimaculoides]|uniref:G-protein coupled receptors family 1 profile domain-containing protein n=1 Tax=Octopus bimaculoides TaxID=37653 RepID=A0A0L8IBH5_OCTBM|nr:melatonin receptor type 1A [Octopus bimaculoides]|eukprot:XP_014782156.1 PREDICTED: melatonin receptor type 1A-like [Octopus bimaculoides]